MVVHVGDEWRPPSLYPLTGPKEWEPPLARRIFHETIHYWQYIGHTHLVHLIDEDWGRLQRFIATGEVVPPGPLRSAFGRPSETAGFSTQDLVEAHARFWDVQALGPPLVIELELDAPTRDVSHILTRETYERLKAEGKIWLRVDEHGRGSAYSSQSFDLAMRLAAGRYAVPYLRLRDRTDDLVAAALFPLCAHFALHSDSPPEFYVALLDRLVSRVRLPRGRAIEGAWRALYDDVWREAAILHVEWRGVEFFTGVAAIHESRLFAEHAGYRMAHAMLLLACDHLEEHRPPQFLVGPPEMPSGMRALWTLDFLLGCCGMTAARPPDLLAFLAPPVIRFADGRSWALGALCDALPYESAAPATTQHEMPRRELAAAMLALDEKWNEMQLRALGV